jgi:hypothetical protein
MTDAEYAATQQQLLAIAAIVSDMDLSGFLQRIERCDALGPMVDPTAYRSGMKRLTTIRRLAEATRDMQPIALELKEELARELADA